MFLSFRWGKHTQQQYRNKHSTQLAKDVVKDDLLPVVTIRHPIAWMKSMCKNPYSAKWKHNHKNCPNLGETGNWHNVTVKYGAGTEEYQSLAHLYNDWYHGYTKHAVYPWIMIRMEDLVFHTKETIRRVCNCAGGQLVQSNHIEYTIESAKSDSPGHDTSTGLVEAWIKYSRPPDVSTEWSTSDIAWSKAILDDELLNMFGYHLKN